MISIVRCARSARTRLDPASASTSKVHRVLAAKRLRLAAFSVARIRPGIRAPCGLAMLAFRVAKTSPTSLAEALGGYAGQPCSRRPELGHRREMRGVLPHVRECLGSALRGDGLTEALTELVLTHLHLEADRVRDELLQQVLLPATDLEEVAHLPERRDDLGSNLVHDEVSVPFNHRHQCLDLIESGTLLLGREQIDRALLLAGNVARHEPSARVSEAACEVLRVELDRGEIRVDEPEKSFPQPRHALELKPVRDLVDRN